MSAKYLNTIHADSTPEYGYWGFGWLSSYWDQEDWIAWHVAMMANYGAVEANKRFITAWEAAPPLAANISFRASWLPGNAIFIEYAKQFGFYDALFSGLLGLVGQVENTAYDVVSNSATAVSNVSTSLKNVSSYLLPIALVVALIVLGIYLFLNLKKLKLT